MLLFSRCCCFLTLLSTFASATPKFPSFLNKKRRVSRYDPTTNSPFNSQHLALALRGGDNSLSISDDDAQARAAYVKRILLHRLEYVERGQRSRDFSKWIKEHGGEATIFSMHGVVDEEQAQQLSSHQGTLPRPHKQHLPVHLTNDDNDPFPLDRLNLDIIATSETPPHMYENDKSASLRPENATSDNQQQQQQQQQQVPFQTTKSSLQHHVSPLVLKSQLLFRATNLALNFLPVWSTVLLAFLSPGFRRRIWYRWLAKCIGSSGAAWIKWGQWSSTRNDMFPDAFCDELSRLHSDAPAHSWKFSQQQMEASLGLTKGSLHSVFDSFDEKPLASGSIAQVHKAVLGDHLVAVKIRHPKVEQLIDLDFRIMAIGASLLDRLPGMSWLRLRESVDQFSHTMAAQAHLHVEGHHLEVLNHNFRSWPHVAFPKPFYASSSVIIETFESGQIVTEFLEYYNDMAAAMNSKAEQMEEEYNVEEPASSQDQSKQNAPAMPSEMKGVRVQGHELVPMDVAQFLVTTGAGVYLKMLLVDNLMHADLHPGNIILDLRRSKKLGSSNSKRAVAVMNEKDPRPGRSRVAITFVDAGMVAQLTDHESSVFIGLLSSLGSGNGREAANFALQFSIENNNALNQEEKEEFSNDMVELFKERCRGYGTGVDVGEVLRAVLGLIRKHQIRIDANYATLVVNVLCIESLARGMFPAYNVLDASRPLLETYRNLCYTDGGEPKPDARRSRFVKGWLSVMYAKKALVDRKFFRNEARKRHARWKSEAAQSS